MDWRKIVKRLIGRSGHDELTSQKLRSNFRANGVEVGMYSYGCFDLRRVPPGVKIGRYCSFADTVQIFLRDHGLEFIGLTAYFYNERLGVVDRSMIEHAVIEIGDDVWLGHNAIITSKVKSIGRGAVVAAGAVVTNPVEPYSIVAGNPARVLKMRFDPATISAIEKTRWWEKDAHELRQMVKDHPEMVFNPKDHFSSDENL